MERIRSLVVAIAAAAALGAGCAAERIGAPAPAPETRLSRAVVERHVRTLASDDMRGRMTGSPESEIAAAYIAGVLERAGVRPAGDDGGFLQRVPLARTVVRALPRVRVESDGGAWTDGAAGADFDLSSEALPSGSYAVVAARSAAEVPREPDPGVALFVDADTADRRQWLSDAGLGDGGGFGLLVRPGSDERRERTTGTPRPSRPRAAWPSAGDSRRRPPWLTAHGPLLKLLRSGEARSIAVETDVATEPVVAHNVVGILPGRRRDDGREPEAVVVTAHYDHIGVSESPGLDDPIFNGADDDASGVAAVLAIAAELAAGPPPERTVVFLLVTGEEMGLLGTNYYLEKPVVPLDRTVANINFEMVGRPDPEVGGAGALWITGYELTNLGPALALAGLEVRCDPRPRENFFRRSDNYAFVRKGIVAQTLSSFALHADYHRPSDSPDTLDYDHLEAAARIGVGAVRLVASGSVDPAWTGDVPVSR